MTLLKNLKKITLITLGYILISSNTYALEETPAFTFGATVPNIKTVNGLGTAIDFNTFVFVGHGEDHSQKIDFLTPTISTKFLTGNGGFELTFLKGASDNETIILDGTVGNQNFLDVIPIDGTISPGAYRNSVIRSLSLNQSIEKINVVYFNELNSLPEGLNFLAQFNPEIGIMINRTRYDIYVDDSQNQSFYHLDETVTSKSIGPVLSLYKEKNFIDANTKLTLGSKFALLATNETLQANQNTIRGNYSAKDKANHLSGMFKLTAGITKKTEQGSSFYILGAVDIANDVSSIKNPRCVAGQDCDDASYAGTQRSAHLVRQTAISPSMTIGFKKKF